jgi:hypothetical protein
MGKALDEEVGGLTKLAKGPHLRELLRTFGKARGAPRTAVLPGAPKVSSVYVALFSYSEGTPPLTKRPV